MAMSTKLYQFIGQSAEFVHVISLEDVMSCVFQLTLSRQIVRRVAQ